MEELTLRDYPLGVLRNILGTSDKQGTDRKLEKYGYGFTSTGRGNTRVYTITSLPDAFHRFRSYCVFNLGFSPNDDFVKVRDFLYLLLGDEDFNWLPDEAKEVYTRLIGKGISRQTIAKYTRQLEKTGFVDTMLVISPSRFKMLKDVSRCSYRFSFHRYSLGIVSLHLRERRKPVIVLCNVSIKYSTIMLCHI